MRKRWEKRGKMYKQSLHLDNFRQRKECLIVTIKTIKKIIEYQQQWQRLGKNVEISKLLFHGIPLVLISSDSSSQCHSNELLTIEYLLPGYHWSGTVVCYYVCRVIAYYYNTILMKDRVHLYHNDTIILQYCTHERQCINIIKKEL